MSYQIMNLPHFLPSFYKMQCHYMYEPIQRIPNICCFHLTCKNMGYYFKCIGTCIKLIWKTGFSSSCKSCIYQVWKKKKKMTYDFQNICP